VGLFLCCLYEEEKLRFFDRPIVKKLIGSVRSGSVTNEKSVEKLREKVNRI